jgi:hypothetical protein
MNYLEQQLLEQKIENEIYLQEIRLVSELGLKLQKDGKMFCYLYSTDSEKGKEDQYLVTGYGYTAGEAASDFWKEFYNGKIKKIKKG